MLSLPLREVSKYGVIFGLYFPHSDCPNARKYWPEITPYLDTFHAVNTLSRLTNLSKPDA